jgi:hypothetical protein
VVEGRGARSPRVLRFQGRSTARNPYFEPYNDGRIVKGALRNDNCQGLAGRQAGCLTHFDWTRQAGGTPAPILPNPRCRQDACPTLGDDDAFVLEAVRFTQYIAEIPNYFIFY